MKPPSESETEDDESFRPQLTHKEHLKLMFEDPVYSQCTQGLLYEGDVKSYEDYVNKLGYEGYKKMVRKHQRKLKAHERGSGRVREFFNKRHENDEYAHSDVNNVYFKKTYRQTDGSNPGLRKSKQFKYDTLPGDAQYTPKDQRRAMSTRKGPSMPKYYHTGGEDEDRDLFYGNHVGTISTTNSRVAKLRKLKWANNLY